MTGTRKACANKIDLDQTAPIQFLTKFAYDTRALDKLYFHKSTVLVHFLKKE